jgi:protein TonB
LPAVVSEAVPAESLRKAASATIDDKPALAPAADRTTHPTNKVIDSNAVDTNVKNAVTSETGISLVNSGSVPTPNIISAMPSSTGSATAPAPAKEVISPQSGKNRIVDAEPAESSHANPTHDGHSIPNFSSVRGSDTPSFAALSGEDDSGASYANKKMLIAAVIVLSLAALGYLGYGMLGKSGAPIAPPSASQPHDSKRPEPTPAPISTPETAPDKPQSSTENPPATRIATDKAPHNELETKKPDSSPLRVKPNVGETETPAQSDEPQLPGSSALASANENSLSGVMSASSPGVPKLSLTSIKISQGVSEGLLIKRVQPRYPQSALAAHAQGAVQIEATVNKEGFVTNPRVLQGDPVLARAALDAVRQWRYKPYYLDGQPVEIQTQITVKFKAN